MKSKLIRPYAYYVRRRLKFRARMAVALQEEIRRDLVRTARDTRFGQDHDFAAIQNYQDFTERVPIGDYEAFRPYADRIKAGDRDVSWPGRPRYLAKTSGTTSGVKYIPLTRDSLPNHFGSARNALFNYVGETGHARWLDGKMIFLSGSPEMDDTNGIPTGRLSGIVNHEVPAWLRTNQLPSYATNCIEDWETKLEAIVDETIAADMRLISGIPPWVQMYYERLLARSGKSTVKELFPNLEMFVYGGVNFEPYRESLERLVGARIPSVETYPASEGFIAFQDSQTEPGLLLNTNSGIFFEFVPTEEMGSDAPRRLSLGEVELGVNYALVLSSTAGLWAYDIGDTVEFVSLTPHRIRVTGRTKHYISAFGEHVIGKEVEAALREVAARHRVEVTEFTVAPQVSPPSGLPYHEWLVEFGRPPEDAARFAEELDRAMVEQNVYYRDLIEGKVLRPLVLTSLPPGAFRRYMKESGKLGGQNKVPRLSNDRGIADRLGGGKGDH
ncbi:GH3 auxin-responsive promoter family protein [Neolewinella litorea]|uniref:GH3 auxin-responsive promoter family protein n=1 Tax=Neolewinella litorea TaxID=2562452 RepID=A0A4S4NNW2_9BACT|nr:GH3 auxin-responsive promoter family protein [Neolewinella litorea]THH41562.1 GH3 auxin-responsive promoter family protein [Neolewinella litorea]